MNHIESLANTICIEYENPSMEFNKFLAEHYKLVNNA